MRRWAHALGFGGHFFTKSRRYTATFRALRAASASWQRRRIADRDQADRHTVAATIVVTALEFAGLGWRTTGDALLANTAAAMARERHRAARDAA
jgi:hypothetical protein